MMILVFLCLNLNYLKENYHYMNLVYISFWNIARKRNFTGRLVVKVDKNWLISRKHFCDL